MKYDALRLRALDVAMKESPNSQSTREPPRSTEYAPSPPIQVESPRNSTLASGQGAALMGSASGEHPRSNPHKSHACLTDVDATPQLAEAVHGNQSHAPLMQCCPEA